MRVLNKAECTEVLSRRRNGEPNWSIASNMGISTDTIRRIGACSNKHFPIEDYLIYDLPDYYLKPLGEKLEAWDLRLSLKLQRLPMSEWGAAI